MIALLADPPTLRDRLSRRLTAAGHEILHPTALDTFRDAIAATDAAVIGAAWLDDGIPLPELDRLAAEYPWYPIILVTEDDPENLRRLARVVVSHIVYLGRDEERLPEVVRNAAADRFFLRAMHRVRAAHRLPGVLREAVLYALAQTPAAEPVDASDPRAPARSVRALARRVSVSERHLARQAKRSRLDLSRFLAWCLALRALELRGATGITWEAIAWRLGYESASGLSQHFLRTFGRRPREIARSDRRIWFHRFERELLDPLLGAHPES